MKKPKSRQAHQPATINAGTITVPDGGLQFVSPSGRIVATLTATPTGGDLRLMDEGGRPKAFLGVDGAGGFAWTRARVGNGGAAIRVLEFDGQQSGVVQVFNSEARECCQVAAGETGGGVSAYRADGTLAAVLGAQTDGGQIALCRPDGVPCIRIGSDGTEGCLSVFNPQGAPSFLVPARKLGERKPAGNQ